MHDNTLFVDCIYTYAIDKLTNMYYTEKYRYINVRRWLSLKTQKFKDIGNQTDYNLIKSQIKETDSITFRTKINVIILTDRLFGCAAGLKE